MVASKKYLLTLGVSFILFIIIFFLCLEVGFFFFFIITFSLCRVGYIYSWLSHELMTICLSICMGKSKTFFGINMNMHVNERHWRFIWVRGRTSHGEGEGDCYSLSPMPWKEFLKN
jgi:hypothetical protein